MKKQYLTVLSCALIGLMGGTIAEAGIESPFREPEPGFHAAPTTDLFRAQELSVDAFGAYANFSGSGADDMWGGGIGVNYFFDRYLGLGLEGLLLDGDRFSRRFDRSGTLGAVNGFISLRVPIEELRIAPYALGGGGGFFGAGGQGQGFVGGGLEFRLSPHTGIFGDGRHVWMRNADNYTLVRFGIRFAF